MAPTNAAHERRIMLSVFSYLYSISGIVIILVFIIEKGVKISFGWKQILALISFIHIETYVCPFFKDLIHVSTPFGIISSIVVEQPVFSSEKKLYYSRFVSGSYEPNAAYFFCYGILTLVVAGAALVSLIGWIDHHWAKQDNVGPIFFFVGAYYIGYYLAYTALSGFLIFIDFSNLFDLLADLAYFLANSIKSKLENDFRSDL
ncbi:hypothetical protein PENTCL1PPCAC_3103 [Pristionchus entomophagus]|uniref:G protein-coupled receptor n=1 Tax=Pristionchus entomophagus TaxID=358040 RepID=A0AAV5SCZ8_9BILA|nr:hypothetical protein PENTCL1PPCAC_3103 [Pristionchus entomophagus]